MYNILFVCYGNICRSPMAEMIFKDIVYKNNKKFLFNCESAAISMEEYGNGIYPKAREVLEKHNVTIEAHKSTVINKKDYKKYDYIICMDYHNYQNLMIIFNDDPDHKVKLLMSFTGSDEEIEDPWYTDKFEEVYDQINRGCNALFDKLVKNYQNSANFAKNGNFID